MLLNPPAREWSGGGGGGVVKKGVKVNGIDKLNASGDINPQTLEAIVNTHYIVLPIHPLHYA